MIELNPNDLVFFAVQISILTAFFVFTFCSVYDLLKYFINKYFS